MKITIGDKYLVTTDDNNYILSKIYKTKKNMIAYKTIGYYSQIKHLANGLLECELKGSDATSLDNLITEIKEIKKLINDFCSKMI